MIRALALCLIALPAAASEDIADQYPASPLYQKPVEVIPGVWSAIGATAPPTYENSGHNNNLSFIVTGEGVVVVNGGAAYLLAEALQLETRFSSVSAPKDSAPSIPFIPIAITIVTNGLRRSVGSLSISPPRRGSARTIS